MKGLENTGKDAMVDQGELIGYAVKWAEGGVFADDVVQRSINS